MWFVDVEQQPVESFMLEAQRNIRGSSPLINVETFEPCVTVLNKLLGELLLTTRIFSWSIITSILYFILLRFVVLLCFLCVGERRNWIGSAREYRELLRSRRKLIKYSKQRLHVERRVTSPRFRCPSMKDCTGCCTSTPISLGVLTDDQRSSPNTSEHRTPNNLQTNRGRTYVVISMWKRKMPKSLRVAEARYDEVPGNPAHFEGSIRSGRL